MKINVAKSFLKATKRLHRNQIDFIEAAIEEISKNPEVGDLKKGDLAGVRVYKFHIHKQMMLLAYLYEENEEQILLLNIRSCP